MELSKDFWTKRDGEEFKKYLLTFSKGEEKSQWEKRILNTAYPCIAVPSEKLREFRQISKGNFLSFLDLKLIDNYSLEVINGGLICKIVDFDLMQDYLNDYLNRCDCWAMVDTLKFKINEKTCEKFYALAKEFLTSSKTFVRRSGVIIFLKLLNFGYIDKILKSIEILKDEKEYYVNMAVAWLLCDCFIKEREKTIKFFKEGKYNDFVINKAISKCRDSFRVSAKDKEMLLGFKRSK